MSSAYEAILMEKRSIVSRLPQNKKAVMIISGGLDSIITSARLMEEHDITLFPLHIERGQTNYESERHSLNFYSDVFRKNYPDKFQEISYIKLNVPPTEIKQDLIPYTQENGHPLRDTMLQMAAVQFAASLQSKGHDIKTVFCAVMPEDYFPHSNLDSIRATNVAVCQNMGNWDWVITSPNIDPLLTDKPIWKPDEIRWAHNHSLSISETISCNVSSKATELLNCGTCSSCTRRKEAFVNANVDDSTIYFNGHQN